VGAFVTIISFVSWLNHWLVGTSGARALALLIYVAAEAATHKVPDSFDKLLHQNFRQNLSLP
jgi:hypothetical protein